MATMLRDSRTASSNFRLNSETWTGVPKPSFLYYIRFVRSSASNTASDWARGIGILAKDIDRPKVSFDTETLNQYNKKRVIQKKVEYEPITFTFHDTVDNRVLNLFEDYFRFYYGDPKNRSAVAWSWDVMSANMNRGAGGWGFQPTIGNPNDSYFFSHIELYTIYGSEYSRFDIVHPKIKTFSQSDMSYEDSNGADLTMTMEYEGLLYVGNNLPIGNQAGLLQEMGLGASGFYEPRTSSDTAVIGNGGQYSRQGSLPTYGTAELFGTNSLSSNQSSNAVSRSSSIIDQNTSFNSIFTGAITVPNQTTTITTTNDPSIGDNIAKRMVKGLKE